MKKVKEQLKSIVQPEKVKTQPYVSKDDILVTDAEILAATGDLHLRTLEFDTLMNDTNVEMKYLSYDDTAAHSDLIHEIRQMNLAQDEVMKDQEKRKLYQHQIVDTVENFIDDKYNDLEKKQAHIEKQFDFLLDTELKGELNYQLGDSKKKVNENNQQYYESLIKKEPLPPMNIDVFFSKPHTKEAQNRGPGGQFEANILKYDPFSYHREETKEGERRAISINPQNSSQTALNMPSNQIPSSGEPLKFEETQAEVIFYQDVF